MKKISKIIFGWMFGVMFAGNLFGMGDKVKPLEKEVTSPATYLLDMPDEVIEYILLNVFSHEIKDYSPAEIVAAIRNFCKLRVVCKRLNCFLSDQEICRFFKRLRIPNRAYYVTGQRALGFATERRYSNRVRILIEAGANPNEQDKLGQTPLHLAAKNGDIVSLRILLVAGADTGKKDLRGKTASEYALELKHVDCVKEISKYLK